ncbi:MAG: hypothetical protein K2W92_03255, partial [Alphaproteobacteria bacterium]|nr:hypothetical protein [Alphaproteobacteria bacterium]
EVSPDKKHLLLVYSQPQVSSSDEETTSQWSAITFVKNDYQSENNHTVTFPQDVSIISPIWSPDSQWVSYLGKGDKFTSLWVTPPQENTPQEGYITPIDSFNPRPMSISVSKIIDKKSICDIVI